MKVNNEEVFIKMRRIILVSVMALAMAVTAFASTPYVGPVSPVPALMQQPQLVRVMELHRSIENKLAEVDSLFDNQLDDTTMHVLRQSLMDGYTLDNIEVLGRQYQLQKNREFYNPKKLHAYDAPMSDADLKDAISLALAHVIIYRHRGVYERNAVKDDGASWGWRVQNNYFEVPGVGNPPMSAMSWYNITTVTSSAFPYALQLGVDLPAGFPVVTRTMADGYSSDLPPLVTLEDHARAVADWFVDAQNHRDDCAGDSTCGGTHYVGYSFNGAFLLDMADALSDTTYADTAKKIFDAYAESHSWVNGIVGADDYLERGYSNYGNWDESVWNCVLYGYNGFKLGQYYATAGYSGMETNYENFGIQYILRILVRYTPDVNSLGYEIGLGNFLRTATLMADTGNPIIAQLREAYRTVLLDARSDIGCYDVGYEPVIGVQGEKSSWWGGSWDDANCIPGGSYVGTQETAYAAMGIALDGIAVDQLDDTANVIFHADVFDGETQNDPTITGQLEPIEGPFAQTPGDHDYGFGWGAWFWADGSYGQTTDLHHGAASECRGECCSGGCGWSWEYIGVSGEMACAMALYGLYR